METGEKFYKHQWKRILGDISLIYEEFSILVVLMKEVLNSVLLVSMSTSPNDLDGLTPSDFLIGRKIISMPHL